MVMFLGALFFIFVEKAYSRSVSSSHVNPDEIKIFEKHLDTKRGFWSPISSSIDWCERNYHVTPYIAEFWNCLSSFSMCIVAGILFVRFVREKVEWRFLLLCLSFGLVGFGSAYFHGTLTYLGQMADELPMVYSMIIWWFILFQMNTKKVSSSSKYWIIFGLFYGLLWTYIHHLKTFIIVFQVHFTMMVIAGILRLVYLYRQRHHHAKPIFYLIVLYGGFILLASIFWLMDQVFCQYFNDKAIFNPQFHAWWHILCAIDCHCGIICAQSMRHLSLKSQQLNQRNNSSPRVFRAEDHLKYQFHYGLPFLQYPNDKQNN